MSSSGPIPNGIICL